MNIKYLDQTDQMRSLDKNDIDIDIEFYEDIRLSNKMIKNSWTIFIEDVCRLRYYVNKYGVNECYKEYMKFSMISDSNKRKMSTSWILHNLHLDSPTYIKHPRTSYLKFPYLYRDLKKEGKFHSPIFMKSVHIDENKIKLVQCGCSGKVVTLHRYFPDKKIDLFISKRKNQKLKPSKFNSMSLFLDRYFEKTDIIFENDICLTVVLDRYSDIGSDYFVYGIGIDSKKTFYDEILENEEVWKYIYHTIIDSNLNNANDYKNLLDRIVLDTQSML